MEDMIKSIKAHLYDKAVSPLFGTFFISWLFWNYKFILVFFSSLPVNEKIDYISSVLYPEISSNLLQGALYPALTAIVFIYVYPYPAKKIYKYTRNKQKELREVKQTIEDETPLTLEESRKIRREIVHIEREYESELNRKNEENKKLKEAFYQFDLDKDSDSDKDSKLPLKESEESYLVNTGQQELLNIIAIKDEQSEKEILDKSNLEEDKVRKQYNIGELVKRKLVNKVLSFNTKEYLYSITHLGRSVLIKKGIV